jgi:hypothetical protein
MEMVGNGIQYYGIGWKNLEHYEDIVEKRGEEKIEA